MPIRLWWSSLAWGAGIALAYTVITIGWDWTYNLQGFHGPLRAQWGRLVHTAFAMAWPAFLYASVGVWLSQLIGAGVKRLWGRKGW